MLKNLGMMIASLALSTAVCAGAATAATPPDLCKDGQISVLRTSKLKSPASRAQFDKAVKDQTAWYRSHGFAKNRILSAAIMVQDAKTKDWTNDPLEVVTLHVDAPGAAAKHDAAYDAFVAEFRASSDITSERILCLREPVK